MTTIHENSHLSSFIDTSLNKTLRLSELHLLYLEQVRKIPVAWAKANCKTMDSSEAGAMLGYPASSSGIMFMGSDYSQWQFKPDTPWASSDGKTPKYRTPKGEYDALLIEHPEIKTYWGDLDALKARCVTVDGKPSILLTEGAFKALTGMLYDIPTVALVGVTMGLTPKSKGKPDLVPVLKRLAEAGFGFIVAFDADAVTNENVRIAEAKLTKVLKSYNCPVLSVTGGWEPGEKGETKGMDDFINKSGIEVFRAILIKAASSEIEESKRDVDSGVSRKKKPPTPRKTAAQIAEQYGHQWKYDDEQKTWRIYSGKHWEKVGIGAFTSLVKTTIDARNIDYTGSAYIKDMRELLELDLRQIRWQHWDRKRYINFSNCVLDGDKLATLEHSPGMGFTSFLPFDYKPLEGDLSDSLEALRANCPNIHKFFRTAMQDDERKMFKLLAIANAILKHRFFDLQQFVHLIGAPGSGKGTFSRLMEKLVGRENFKGCQLDRLSDGSTKASVVDKQLVIFADERKPVGIDSILSFTGGDAVSYRELHTPAADAFFYGCFLICSNKPIFVGDTTGLERRLCLVHFDNPIPTEKRDHAIESEFETEIPALIGIALSLANTAVTQAIRGIGTERIAEFKAKEWEMKVETSSTAAFFDIELVLDPTATTSVGKLYDAYKHFCEEGGLKTFSVVKFPKMLADLMADENLPATRHQGRIASFEGLRMREKSDTQPTHSETLTTVAGVTAPVSGSLAGVAAGVEPARDMNQRGLRGFATKYLRESENDDDCLLEAEESDLEVDLPPPTPATPADSLPARDTTPAATPAEVVQVTPPTPATPASGQRHILVVGDRVVVTKEPYLKKKIKGVIVKITEHSTHTNLRVKFDKEVSLVQEAEFYAGDLMYLAPGMG